MTAAAAAAAAAELADLANETPPRRLRREASLVADLVDRAYYTLTNAAALAPGEDPVEHFCRVGWRELRKPRPDFDVWWYWVNNLDPSSEDVDPLVHYALVGRDLGLSTRPQPPADRREGHRLPQDRPVRRACLFAGFDLDGVIDDTVVLLVTELARHADVFYLSDGYLPPEELAKLDGITRGAWAVRHGAYDFGSYSMLARDLVGWDRLADYDEVLLVNDSCFLVHPLDEVFAAMDARPCDWWGLQATKGLASTRDNRRNGFRDPIPMDTVRTDLLADFEEDPVYDFHVGSYFLALRRPVLDDPVVRNLLDSVRPQPGKLLVVLKYEVGLTHLLIGRGHDLDTYLPDLLPFHPLFSETHFDLIRDGFPLLKRYLIHQNHYDVPDLARWKERVLVAAPDAPVDLFERALERTAPDDRLRRSLAITRGADGSVKVPRVLRGAAYERKDASVEKRPDVWAFAVDPDRHLLPANSRAIFEAVKDDPAITKVILTRSRRVELTGSSVVVEPLLSPAGRSQLMRAGVVFVESRLRQSLLAPVSTERQTVIAVRDGLLLERTGSAAAPPTVPGPPAHLSEPLHYLHDVPERTMTALLVASDVDRLAALATYGPAPLNQTWQTGLPAHDFLLAPEELLPSDHREQLDRLRAELAGRRLLLFAPSLRLTGSAREPYVFSDAECAALRHWSSRNDVAIGVRPAPGDLERSYTTQLEGMALDLSEQRYPALHPVLRSADALLTDFAGTALDLAATGRPVVSFVHDLPDVEDHLLYDLDHFFPGPVSSDFDGLTASLESVFDQPDEALHERVRDLLVDHRDGASTTRVLERLAAEREAAR
ncbi:Rhamnan synthesis protein F [Nocardioides terrae]|uniref:Rhamnan synthesis protein F n=1 Tax=Nocardioides terrae TaxID=574651 RepID=A0A1I1J3Q8_9ACTN|nr:CDP-glycerol glycerophosphotransferase family protein [Nocardioides terrae]SFC43134.1 Rhamnan synthesis protein F [Nocardioides terrae]